MSEDSLATSTAILAAAYAVRQPVSSMTRAAVPSLDELRVLSGGEAAVWVMEADETANGLGLSRDVGFCTGSVGGVGVETPSRFDLRKRNISKVDGPKLVDL